MNRAIFLLSIAACTHDTGPKTDAGPAADADSDTDTDTDTDADSDADADTDVPGVDADGDGFGAEVDCDDADATVFPGAPDICGDDRVTDCNRGADTNLATVDGGASFGVLSDALLAAASGSEIRVCPGTYIGPFEATVPVRLVAHGDATDTFLDGDGQGTTLALPGGSEVVGLTVRNGGQTDSGGGLRLTSEGTLRVERTLVTGNRARFGGGIALPPASVATLVDTVVRLNDAVEDAGGVFVDEGSVLDLGAGSSLEDNRAVSSGGGAFVRNGTILGGTIRGNTAGLMGGGVQILGGTIEGAVLTGNDAFSGGGAYVETDVTLRDTTITDNEATWSGGGIGEICCLLEVPVRHLAIEGGVVSGNRAEQGGGMYADTPVTMNGTTFADNTAIEGGGIYMIDGEVTMSGGAVLGNAATQRGGGVMIYVSYELGYYLPLFVSQGADFGTGTDDNAPDDAYVSGLEGAQNGSVSEQGYAADAFFSCGEPGCAVLP